VSSPARAALVAALLAAHAALAISSLWVKSVTFDELTHLPSGLAAVATGEVRLNPQHPPLVKLLAGLAASLRRPTLRLDGDAYAEGREWDFGREVLFEMGNDHMALLRAGRLPVVAISVLAGLLVFVWSRRRFGDAGGFLSLALYAFAPTVLAHARFVTMDAAASAGALATSYLFWRSQRAPSAARELACGLALGATLASKFSGALLVPALALCQLAAGDVRSARRLRSWLVILPVAAVVVHAAYLFPDHPARWLADASFLHGDHPPDYVHYLAGEFRSGRFPHYFPLAMAVKSALPGLAAMLAGLLLAAVRREHWRDDVYLWLPALFWIASHALLADNLGVRYVLPAYGLLFVLAGGLAPVAAALAGRPARAAVALLALAQAGVALAVHPDYLSYFNRLAGGSGAGTRWLDDSNVDWGQELYRLPAWLAAHGIERVRLFHFGTGDPEAYGVPVEPFLASDWRDAPRPGAYVVSAHWLVHGLHQADTREMNSDWLRRYRPRDVLGGSLYLYVFDGAPRTMSSTSSSSASPAATRTATTRP
jgi:hypothetical protein